VAIDGCQMVKLGFKCLQAAHHLLKLLLNARKTLFQFDGLGNVLD
jgi:hypothetical protein